MLKPPQRSDEHGNTEKCGYKSRGFINDRIVVVNGGIQPEVFGLFVETLIDLIEIIRLYRSRAQTNPRFCL